jgi:hypothetical protein
MAKGQLVAQVDVPFQCSGEIHTVRLVSRRVSVKDGTPYTTFENTLEVDQQAHDVELEDALVALGGEPSPCMQLASQWKDSPYQRSVILYTLAPTRKLRSRIAIAWVEMVAPIWAAEKGTTSYSAAAAFHMAKAYLDERATLDQLRAPLAEYMSAREGDIRSSDCETGFSAFTGPSMFADKAMIDAAEFTARPNIGTSQSIFTDVSFNVREAVDRDSKQDVYAPPISKEAQIAVERGVPGLASILCEARMVSRAIEIFSKLGGFAP